MENKKTRRATITTAKDRGGDIFVFLEQAVGASKQSQVTFLELFQGSLRIPTNGEKVSTSNVWNTPRRFVSDTNATSIAVDKYPLTWLELFLRGA